MEYILFYCMTAVICCISIAFFRFAAQEIEKPFPWKVWFAMVLYDVLVVWLLYWHYEESAVDILKYLTFGTVLWVCGWTDYKEYLILNRILLLALLLRMVWLGFEFLIYGNVEFTYIVMSAAIAAIMLAVASLLCRVVSPGAVGFGDMKLLIVLGLYTGVDLAVTILIDTFLVMFVVSVVLLLMKKVNRRTVVPFAPFLVTGMVIASILTGI